MPALDLGAALQSLALVGLAELGDKSQVVCLMLGSRYRAAPVIAGAIAAFSVLDLLAVAVGAGVGTLVPERVIASVVAVLFLGFGVAALRSKGGEDGEVIEQTAGRSVFIATFGLLFVAELGDKTQIAVAGIAAATVAPLSVWIGATLALSITSVAGVLLGRALLERLPVTWTRRGAGVLFLVFGVLAAVRALFGG